MREIVLRSGSLNYDVNAASLETAIAPGGKSLTVQADTPGTDINLIVKRYQSTGELPLRNLPPFGDEFAEIEDFKDALTLVRRAEEAFMQQPADVRANFDNDPAKYVAYCEKHFDNPVKMKEMFPDWVVPEVKPVEPVVDKK